MIGASPAFNLLSPATAPALSVMLAAIEARDEGAWFRPHSFDTGFLVEKLCRPDILDLYYVLHDRSEILAYGLLRGWDEGYVVPSLGIAVSPNFRGLGLGRLTMNWLHMAAQLRGSRSVRLRVSLDNARAIALYRTEGYRFEKNQATEDLLTGTKDLISR